jgi:transposase InsO family protein
MTTERKVTLVEEARETYGLKVALKAVDLPKSTWYYHQKHQVTYEERYAHLLPVLATIAREHPAYGRPRITVELRETYGYHINHKVVQRLLRLWELRLLRNTRSPKPSRIRQVIITAGERVNLVAQREHIGLFEVAYTDFTELPFADGTQKAYLMPIIGHVCKMAYGWAVGESANTALALKTWQRAKSTFEEYHIPYVGMIIHHDQGAVFTSYDWTGQLLLKDGVRVSYALGGAKDNPQMESFTGRFKEENHSLFLDAHSLAELAAVVDERMRYYNMERRHSATDYQSPVSYFTHVRSGLVEDPRRESQEAAQRSSARTD